MPRTSRTHWTRRQSTCAKQNLRSRQKRKRPSQGSESATPDGIPVAESFFHRYRSHYAGVAEQADARVSKTRSPKEYRFDPDHPHHRLTATATQRDYKGCQRG